MKKPVLFFFFFVENKNISLVSKRELYTWYVIN
jgi:hypothetical protein